MTSDMSASKIVIPYHPIHIEEAQVLISQWSRPIFTQSTPDTTLAHFELEVAEVRKAHESGSFVDLTEKCADAPIMLIQFCNHSGVDLGRALRYKMRINVSREWLPPNEDGIVFHKKEE